MIQIDLPTLVKRLNLFSRQALEMAASECMSQQAAEITVSHVLIQMLAMPRSDLRVITRQGDIGMEELRQALTVENYTTARSADSYPAFSPMLVEWLKEGWLLASHFNAATPLAKRTDSAKSPPVASATANAP